MGWAGGLIHDRAGAEPAALVVACVPDPAPIIPFPAAVMPLPIAAPSVESVPPVLPRPSFGGPPPARAGLAMPLPRPAFGAARPPLPFRAVNIPGKAGYDPGFQRHHLLPRQLLSARCFGPLMADIGRDRVGFDDFRSNGLLLPATDRAALRIGLPLHRGPHRDYNALVIERVGQIEASWARLRLRAPDRAADEAAMRMGVLQKALRRRLLQPPATPLRLNRHDPVGRDTDFTEIDNLIEALWPATEPATDALPAPGFGQPAQPAPSNLALAC